MTTQVDIKQWLKRGLKQDEKTTHLIVVYDSFDHEDYPVWVTEDQDVNTIYNKYNGKNMQRVMEVYDYSKPWVDQLNERRAMNL